MPKRKRLTVSARVVTAGRLRKCYHSPSHQVRKGDICLEVKDGMAWKGYCAACAEAMVQASQSDLLSLKHSLISREGNDS